MKKQNSFPKTDGSKAVLFRAMSSEDIPVLVEMDAVSNHPSWTEKMFARELELPFSRSIVALLAGENSGSMGPSGAIAGFGIIWLVAGSSQLLQCAVSPALRRKGIGTGLLKQLMDAARDEGCAKMELEFREGNSAAQSLYEKMGFKMISKRRKFYPDCDGILMECDLV